MSPIYLDYRAWRASEMYMLSVTLIRMATTGLINNYFVRKLEEKLQSAGRSFFYWSFGISKWVNSMIPSAWITGPRKRPGLQKSMALIMMATRGLINTDLSADSRRSCKVRVVLLPIEVLASENGWMPWASWVLMLIRLDRFLARVSD